MSPLPPFTNQMFLNSNIDQYVTYIRKEHADSLNFAYRLNQFGNKFLFSISVTSDDTKGLILSSLLGRILTSFQASVIICERGMPLEAQIILRTILEITFKIGAIASDEKSMQRFIGEGLINKKGKYKKLKKLTSSDFQNEIEDISKHHQELEKRIELEGIKEFNTYEFSQKAGLENFYHSAYSILSDAVHSTINTLEKSLNLDDNGNLISLNYGFSDENLDDYVFTACESLIISLRFVSEAIESDLINEVLEIQNDFAEIYNKVNKID